MRERRDLEIRKEISVGRGNTLKRRGMEKEEEIRHDTKTKFAIGIFERPNR